MPFDPDPDDLCAYFCQWAVDGVIFFTFDGVDYACACPPLDPLLLSGKPQTGDEDDSGE